MFFILSKTLNYLTQPLTIICALLLLSLVVRTPKWKKYLFRGGVVLLFFFSNEFIANEVVALWEVKATPFSEIKKTYAYGIVLTGVTRSEMLPPDRVYFQRGADRVTHTVQLYKLGLIKKILVSGGSGRLIDIGEKEADQIGSALELMGIPPSAILIENKSKNTHESALEVKKILEGLTTPEQCILVTSGYHIRRSAASFAKVGFKMDTFATDFISHKRSFTLDVLLVPKLEAMGMWQTTLKEWVGFCAYWISGYV